MGLKFSLLVILMYVFVTNAFLWLYSISKCKIFTSMNAHFLSYITLYRVRGHIVKGRQIIARLGDLFMPHNFQQWYQRKLNLSDTNLESRIAASFLLFRRN